MFFVMGVKFYFYINLRMHSFVWVRACVHVVRAGTLIQFALMYLLYLFIYFIQLVGCGYGMLCLLPPDGWIWCEDLDPL
jgi:hypothetical protein